MWVVHFKPYSGHVCWHCQTVLSYFAVSINAFSSLLVSLGFSLHSRGHSSHFWLKTRRYPSALLQARSWPPSCFHFAEELLLYSKICLYPSNVSYFRWAHYIIGVRLYHSCCSFVHFQCFCPTKAGSKYLFQIVSVVYVLDQREPYHCHAFSLPHMHPRVSFGSFFHLFPTLSRLMIFTGVIVTSFQLGNRGRNNAVLRR